MRASRWLTLLTGVSLALATGPHASAQPSQAMTPGPLSRRDLDRRVVEMLTGVLQEGTQLHNEGYPVACTYLFHGSLTAIKPLLDHHPEVQKTMRKGMAAAHAHVAASDRAFALRMVILDVQKTLTPPMPTVGVGKTLWERLGGEENVRLIVDDFIDWAILDPKVNLSRHGKYPMKPERVANFKSQLIRMTSTVTGGPDKYPGSGMKAVHQGMAITESEFDAMMKNLSVALLAHKVQPKDHDDMMGIVGVTRRLIVEPKRAGNDPAPTGATLWERMGGEENVRLIVNDFVDGAIKDPLVNFSRGGKFPMDAKRVAHLKEKIFKLASATAKGPFEYDGKTMEEAHAKMGITDAELDACLKVLVVAMFKNKVQPKDVDLIIKAVEAYRGVFVEKKASQLRAPALPRETETSREAGIAGGDVEVAVAARGMPAMGGGWSVAAECGAVVNRVADWVTSGSLSDPATWLR